MVGAAFFLMGKSIARPLRRLWGETPTVKNERLKIHPSEGGLPKKANVNRNCNKSVRFERGDETRILIFLSANGFCLAFARFNSRRPGEPLEARFDPVQVFFGQFLDVKQ